MRIYRKLPLLLGMALAAPLVGCDADHTGSGHWAEEFRAASDFDRIEVSGAVDLFVEVDPNAEAELVVAGDDNLLLHVETEISGGTLHVDTDGWLNPQFPLEVWVKVRNLRGLDLSGASGVTAWGIASNRLDVDVSGASNVRLAGLVNDLRFDGSGASRLHAASLRGDKVDLEASGATRADVCVKDKLRIDVSGASAVRYFGPVQDVQQDATGASEVAFGGPSCAAFTPPVRSGPSGGDCSCPAGNGGGNGYTGGGWDDGGWGDGNNGGGSGGGSDGGSGSDGSGSDGGSGSGSDGGSDGGSGSDGSGSGSGSGGSGGGSSGSGSDGSAGSGSGSGSGSGGNGYQGGDDGCGS